MVINLCFLYSNSIKFNNYIILPELQYLSDYVFLVVNISIEKEFFQDKCYTIVKNSKEEKDFIAEFINSIENINMTNISNKDNLEYIVQEYSNILETIWFKYLKYINITRCSKKW